MINAILSMLIAAHAPNPEPLAYSIMNVAIREDVDPILMTQVVIAESNGNPQAINTRTGDYGLMQIHLDAHPQIGLLCAMSIDCNLTAGAKIIKTLDRICQYNIGKKSMTEARLKKCLKYERRLSIIAAGGN